MSEEKKPPVVLSDALEALVDRATGAEVVSFRLPSIAERYRYNTAILGAAGYENGEKVRDGDGWSITAIYVSIVGTCWLAPDALYGPDPTAAPAPVRFPTLRDHGRDPITHGEAVFDALYAHGFRSWDDLSDVGEALYRRFMSDLAELDRKVEGAASDFG